MREKITNNFYGWLCQKIHFPLTGQIELTYRCNLNCIHCYCKGSEDKSKELNTSQWKKIFDEIKNEGCLALTFTGGEPLIRDDFLELYLYAKKQGFIITLFTNGRALNNELSSYLEKYPPASVEITLNGITKSAYESISRVEGSFENVLKNIKKLTEKKIKLILKSNLLKQNQAELKDIKAFVDKFLGKAKDKYYFRFDPIIFPRLNGDTTPCNYRLSFDEMQWVFNQDEDIRKEYQDSLDSDLSRLDRHRDFLYQCNTWQSHFFINPSGQLKFCGFIEKFSVNLKASSFKEGFYKSFPKVFAAKFKTDSKCKNCGLRALCHNCPARAFLETGNEEAPVPYFCQLAEAKAREMGLLSNNARSGL